MPGFFSRLKGRDGPKARKGIQEHAYNPEPQKPRWEDAWLRTSVEPDEVQELLKGCTVELKHRGLDMPFLLLPFRPTSDPSAARTFIRHFFDLDQPLHGEVLAQELRLTEPMVLCSVLKWCWSRLPGGVVGWDAYELFKVGESDSNMARDSFSTFIPLSVDSDARARIIFDFFDLLSAIAAHGKTNGMGGRKLSRLAGWWAFDHIEDGNGFEGGYKKWAAAADATSHLFFAYLRSQTPNSVKGLNGITTLPMSLQKLVSETEYPPERPANMQTKTLKVVMIVDSVSPTPFALLRRANHFQYRDDDRALQEFAEFEDPVKALTDECRRVLRSISSVNQSQVSSSKDSTGLTDASWSRFEDIGFSGAFEEEDEDDESNFGKKRPQPLRKPAQQNNHNGARPTTPSWADFLSEGFVDEAGNNPAPLLLPPDKVLPPIDTRGRSSQSHQPKMNGRLEPGELASITRFELDDAFWWVWITSLAGEEYADRKAAFGRCALIETSIPGGRWLVMEEKIKGAAPDPEEGAYIAEKKSFWKRSQKSKGSTRRKSIGKYALSDSTNLRAPPFSTNQSNGMSKTSIGPDQHARIQAAAAQLQQKQRDKDEGTGTRRGRNDSDAMSQKTNSVMTLGTVFMNDASPAMKWANQYDKSAIREAYLANSDHGKGLGVANVANGITPPKSQDTIKPAIGNGEDSSERNANGPAVPAKESSPLRAAASPALFPPTPAQHRFQDEDVQLTEKAAEVALPKDNHASLKPKATAPLQVRPSMDQNGYISKSQAKANKLSKKRESSTNGFKRMFGRKKRESKVIEHPPQATNGRDALQAPQPQRSGSGLGRRLSALRRKTPTEQPAPAVVAKSPAPISTAPESRPISVAQSTTPVASPQQQHDDRSYDPYVQEDQLSRVDTADAHEARQAFSSFDQGPLEDVPAFVPEAESEDDAIPPAVQKNRSAENGTELTKAVSPPPASGDRWAQIRKNAAERAAKQSDEKTAPSPQKATDKTDGDDGETSGEETIESRVARIKARVAELTGNMEGQEIGKPTAAVAGAPKRKV